MQGTGFFTLCDWKNNATGFKGIIMNNKKLNKICKKTSNGEPIYIVEKLGPWG
jgi:hypothetical protein